MIELLVTALIAVSPLPEGAAPQALPLPHFPDTLHALVWRNWQVTPVDRIADTVGAKPEDIIAIGRSMGLQGPPEITESQWRRSHITVIRRNWHLLPYDQLLTLLGWTAEEMAYVLREDDFLFVKLGNLKPTCEPIRYYPPQVEALEHARYIRDVVEDAFPEGVGLTQEPLFDFVDQLSKMPEKVEAPLQMDGFDPRFCYSYFALYGDPLLDPSIDPYPEGLLARLSAAGVNGVWLQGVLFKLAPYQWDESLHEGYETRLENLRALVARAKRHGIGVYLYLNEPRSMPLSFFEEHPDLRGVTEGDWAAVCTTVPEVKDYLRGSVASVCRAVPDLAGFFTITGSENLTNCYSHGQGQNCPQCKNRTPAEVVAEVNALIVDGIKEAGHNGRLIAWDWGWREWAPEAIALLPKEATLQSVSEWSIPINRGGIETTVGEYSISTIGPGPRATKHWAVARENGLRTNAKIQAGTTWEISAAPYIPALVNVAQHAANLREANIDGLMLGWTLGGYPSPNLEVVAEVAQDGDIDGALQRVATRRYGADRADAVVSAWRQFSTAFSEFPYNGSVVYRAPLQMGPANLVWGRPTGYASTMVGIPYDDLQGWRGPYPPDVFIGQFDKMADGFDEGVATLKAALEKSPQDALQGELNVGETAAIHFRSIANQCRFVQARDRLIQTESKDEATKILNELEMLLTSELELAQRLHDIQSRDSRMGFEASNHYFYIPMDLAEKVINCRDLLDRWIPEQRAAVEGLAE